MVDTALLNWSLNQFLVMLIIMSRVGPLIFFMPILGADSVPPQVKILFTLITALVLVPVVKVSAALLPTTPVGFVVFVGCEVLFGATLAILAHLLFAATELAGQMVSVAMGMGMAGVMDPQFGTEISLTGFFWNIVTILIFLHLDGLHLFFKTLVASFAWVEPGTIHLHQISLDNLLHATNHMFVLAIQIMAPTAAALFFSHVGMGIISKTVPQIPVMMVAMPINIAIGLIFLGLSMPYLLPLLSKNFALFGEELAWLAKGLGR